MAAVVQQLPVGKDPPAGHAAAPQGTISLIIPTLNEQRHIARTIAHARGARGVEIIVVDGGSTDETVKIAREMEATIIRGRPGRARQMNAGAAAACGEVLLFLHADTLLPPRYEAHVAGVLAEPGVVLGAFAFRLDERRAALRLVERCVSWRGRWLNMPYGDQALFLYRDTFLQLGGFPDVPAMEDFELVRRAKRAGRVALARAPVTTSSRRWAAHGIVRTATVNQVCVVARLCGIPAIRIARWRRRWLP